MCFELRITECIPLCHASQRKILCSGYKVRHFTEGKSEDSSVAFMLSDSISKLTEEQL